MVRVIQALAEDWRRLDERIAKSIPVSGLGCLGFCSRLFAHAGDLHCPA
jgi:hypothetical protein